jgi:cytochrome c oxidase subunit III
VNLTVASIAVIAGILVWWLAVRRLTAKPWEAQGTFDGRDTAETMRAAPARIGLWVFLAVATSFFVLFITAYSIRMTPHLPQGDVLRDWRPVAEPPVLWLNTVLLVLSSAGMQFARSAIARGEPGRARAGMFAGGAFAAAFLAGQLLAWRQLQAAGYYAAGNPANAFFYVLTGVHGLHLLGGLFVWGRAAARMSRSVAPSGTARLTIELCTVYWHYLLVVWLVLFGLLLIT